MKPTDPEQHDEPTDADLQAAWLDDEHEDSGETFITVYNRYRDEVREAMVLTGLEPREAENRVGSVFLRAREAVVPVDMPLRERLLKVARTVANDPEWSPPD